MKSSPSRHDGTVTFAEPMPNTTEPRRPPSQHRQLGLFTYGTLMPGEPRWQFLSPYVVGSGVRVVVPGDLYDTGLGYPAAVFADDPRYRGGTINGIRFALDPHRYDDAVQLLDQVEGAVEGMYERVVVGTDDGTRLWAYQVGTGVPLAPIIGGDWSNRTTK